MSYWLVWLFVGRAKQLGSDSLLNNHVHLRSKWLELNLKKDKRRRKKKRNNET